MKHKCIFCWVDCYSLEGLQAHSAMCTKHPAVRECNRLKVEFTQLMEFLKQPRVATVMVKKIAQILKEAEKGKI